MSFKNLKTLFLYFILVIGVTGCAVKDGKIVSNIKDFKQPETLIKDDIRKSGQSEISKTMGMGPKPVVGDASKLKKRKTISDFRDIQILQSLSLSCKSYALCTAPWRFGATSMSPCARGGARVDSHVKKKIRLYFLPDLA